MNLVETPITPGDSGSARAGVAALRLRRSGGLVQEVVEGLTASIQDGVIAAGGKLPAESEIMARFGVSRTVVREAISHLRANQLVETRHGVGTFAMEARNSGSFRLAPGDFETVADIIALLELRISLETEAAGLAAQRRTPAHLDAMESHLRAFRVAIERDAETIPSDFEFHHEIARATGNRHFADLMTYLGTMIIPRTRINTASIAPGGRTNYLRRVQAEHESIFNALRNQDSDSARVAMRTHLSNSRDRLKNALEKMS